MNINNEILLPTFGIIKHIRYPLESIKNQKTTSIMIHKLIIQPYAG